MNDMFVSTVSLIGFGGLVTLGGFVWKLADRLVTLEHEAASAMTEAHRTNGEVRNIAQRLSEFQLDATARFVTNDALSGVETKVLAAIDRLADRLDRIIESRAK